MSITAKPPRQTRLLLTAVINLPEVLLMGSSAGSSQSMEQFCEDLQQETRHVVDEQSEHIKDSNIYLAHYSQMTTMTPSSLGRSNITQSWCCQNLAAKT